MPNMTKTILVQVARFKRETGYLRYVVWGDDRTQACPATDLELSTEKRVLERWYEAVDAGVRELVS